MDKKEFQGEIRYIDPSRIAKDGVKDELANFFLTLAVIYNDLKDLILFQGMLYEQYRLPTDVKPSVHSGEFAGVNVHINKLIISHVHEFFKFIKTNEEILSSSEFSEVLHKTDNKMVINEWNTLINIAIGKDVRYDKLTNDLIQIRNNVSFHYYQSGKELGKSFQDFFFKRDKIERNDLAYYSLGETMTETRFYYADASVEEYLRNKFVGPPKEGDSRAEPLNFKTGLMMDTVRAINLTIMRIMKAYLKNRPKTS